MQDVIRVRRAFQTRNRAQVFVDGIDLMVSYVMKRWPRHNLEKASVVRRRKAVCRRRSWRNVCTGRMDFIEINTGPHDLPELPKRVTPFSPPSLVRRQVASDDVWSKIAYITWVIETWG